MITIDTGTVAVICSSAVTALGVIVPIIRDRMALTKIRHEELARFIDYASEQVFVKEDLSALSVDLWKRFGEVSYYCSFGQMQVIEKFIRAMEKPYEIFPAERKFAFRLMCFELSSSESKWLHFWHRRKLIKALKKEKETQDALESSIN